MATTLYPEESIYNYLPDIFPAEKKIKYKPRYLPVLSMEDKVRKKTMKTMGPAKVEAPSPDKYLKKHSKEPKLPEKKEHSHRTCTCTTKKPRVPLRSEHPQMQLNTQKNFLKPTATVRPKSHEAISVDTNRGHRAPLEHSGLVPKYIKKKSYGKVPVYLQHRIQEMERSTEDHNMYVKDRSPMRQLSEEERQDNLERLKRTLAEVMEKYQRMPVVVDTLMRKTRKEQLEEEMTQLESDVFLFEKFKTIYIAN
ncbi:enkurin [Corythoichthys intestinalis]|uniref:enkurin n=1 Tax=Corythoichthys intestinalis TaxID=161448 RepID=UPI0025A51D6C|nr:enkurin [Corythoichthys intestinalis]XP_061810355.1 enkurin-like [Nerophis lumbriciformis]